MTTTTRMRPPADDERTIEQLTMFDKVIHVSKQELIGLDVVADTRQRAETEFEQIWVGQNRTARVGVAE